MREKVKVKKKSSIILLRGVRGQRTELSVASPELRYKI